MMLSSTFASPRNKQRGGNLHSYRTEPLLVDAKRQSAKLAGGKNFALDADIGGNVAHLPSGWLVKRGHQRKNWLRRYCVITPSGSLVYYKDDRCLKAKGTIPLALYWLDVTVDANFESEDGFIGFILHQSHTTKVFTSYHFRVELPVESLDGTALDNDEAKKVQLDTLFRWKNALRNVGVVEKVYVKEIDFWYPGKYLGIRNGNPYLRPKPAGQPERTATELPP
jgi:hypothetical protein